MQTLKLTNKYETYPEYKDSGAEWLGKIPKGWEMTNLQHLFKKIKRFGFENEELLSVYRDRGVIPKSSRDDNFNKASEDLSTYQLVEVGDLAINKMKAWQGSVAISSLKGIVSPAYFICKPLTKDNPRYLHHLLRSDLYIKQYERNSGGVRNDQWDLNYDKFRKLEVAIPNYEMQDTIASYLDEKTALIDQIIEKKEMLIELLREKRRAVINYHLTDKSSILDGVWRTEKIKHLIKSIESGVWGDNPIGNLADIKCLRVADFDYENLSFSDVETVRNNPDLSKKKILQNNDILMEKSGGGEKTPVGRAILFNSNEKMVCANFIDIVRANREKVLPEFLVLFLSDLYSQRLNTKYIKQNTGIQNMDIKSYFNEMISFPDLKIQRNIVNLVYEKINNFDVIFTEVEKSIQLLKEFKLSLISNVVTGKIKI